MVMDSQDNPYSISERSRTGITCKTCEKGELQRRETYRLGTPLAIIGAFFFYFGCLLLVLGIMFTLITQSIAASMPKELNQGFEKVLVELDFPREIKEKVMSKRTLSDAERSSLTKRQIEFLHRLNSRKLVTFSRVVNTRILLPMFAISFFLILAGWKLKRRMKILQCENCGAAIPES